MKHETQALGRASHNGRTFSVHPVFTCAQPMESFAPNVFPSKTQIMPSIYADIDISKLMRVGYRFWISSSVHFMFHVYLLYDPFLSCPISNKAAPSLLRAFLNLNHQFAVSDVVYSKESKPRVLDRIPCHKPCSREALQLPWASHIGFVDIFSRDWIH